GVQQKLSAEKKKSLCIFLNAQGAECEVGEEGALHDQQASSDDAHPPKGNRTAEEELEIYISKVLPLKNGEKYETKQKALSICKLFSHNLTRTKVRIYDPIVGERRLSLHQLLSELVVYREYPWAALSQIATDWARCVSGSPHLTAHLGPRRRYKPGPMGSIAF
ncbi:hypothetical protein CYMTET_30567, partial [Cymbomonas tetramitiformis]